MKVINFSKKLQEHDIELNNLVYKNKNENVNKTKSKVKHATTLKQSISNAKNILNPTKKYTTKLT